jgi:tRNA(Arg) A34 adenosine deaminase TadA/uncharacterized protein YndB with AHSA1/START domain
MSDPLVLTQLVPLPVEEVWRAWTTADGWARWWWPHWPATRYDVDARAGGFYRAWDPEHRVGVHGTFLVVEAPRTLAMTWFWEGEVADPPRDEVVVELTEQEGGTLVTVTHRGPVVRAGDSDYRAGWEFVLGNLARVGRLGSATGPERALTDVDLQHLRRCVELAERAVEMGDEPFGSVLVGGGGEVLLEDHNHVAGGDRTQHPELAIARWAAEHLTPRERRAATVYTSGEHCPMCAGAHGWVGLGRIVVATSTEQLTGWLRELGLPPGAVAPLPVVAVVPGAVVDGPAPELADAVRELHRRAHGASG